MIDLIDGHMHLEYGPLTEEYVLRFVKEAERKGLSEIQILDHTHRFKEFEECYEELKEYDIQKTWLENPDMKFKDSIQDYISLMQNVQAKDLPIKVKYGLEVCYTPKSEERLRSILKDNHFDFVVGAIHSVDGILYDMKFSKELLWDVYSADHIYRRYYALLKQCADSGLFTQLAHPDTIKLFEIYPEYDLTETYLELCEILKKHGMKAEHNTGCHYRYNHPDIGLSDELLKIFIAQGVEVITASDAHHPEDVGSYIKEAQEKINLYKRKQ